MSRNLYVNGYVRLKSGRTVQLPVVPASLNSAGTVVPIRDFTDKELAQIGRAYATYLRRQAEADRALHKALHRPHVEA